MTTGIIGSISSLHSAGLGFFRQWDGTNGKIEFDGHKYRDKWNPFTSDVRSSRCVPDDVTGNIIFGSHVDAFADYWSSTQEMKLQSKLVSKIKGHDFNLAVNVFQGKLTVNMVVNTLGQLGRSFTRLKHGDIPGAFKELGATQRGKLHKKDIPGRWLEMQYGWLPLVGDSFEAAKAFAALSNKERCLRFPVSVSVKFENHVSPSPTLWSTTTKGFARRSYLYEAEESISAQRSLGLIDPLSVVWELLPYSFVVDWFYPIGTYLENLAVIPSLKGRFLQTDVIKATSTCTPIDLGYLNAEYEFRSTSVTRRVFNALALPTARPKFVPFPEAMSPKRVWNALALASQRFLLSSPKKAFVPRKGLDYYSE